MDKFHKNMLDTNDILCTYFHLFKVQNQIELAHNILSQSNGKGSVWGADNVLGQDLVALRFLGKWKGLCNTRED